MHDNYLPSETVCVIMLHNEGLGRKQNHTDSLGRKLFFAESSLCRIKPEIVDTLSGRQNFSLRTDGTKPNIGGLVYTL